MLDLVLYAAAGIWLGTFTGLIPGIHVNNIAPVMVGLAAASGLPPTNLATLVVAMMTTHIFVSYIPATFLGAPDVGTELSVLPAHRLLLEGRGYEAIRLTTLGCLGALMIGAVLALPLSLVFSPAYEIMRPHMHWLLLVITGIMIALEHSWRKILWAMTIFLLSGLLGLLTLDTNLVRGDVALMPLLSGLFGVSVLIPSIFRNTGLPRQNVDTRKPIELITDLKALGAGTGAGVLTGIMPGIGPSQGTVLAQMATRSDGAEAFLVGVSAVNMAKSLFSFVALYAIGRPRSGAAVAVDQLLGDVGFNELLLLIGAALMAGGVAAIIHLKLGGLAALHIGKIPYRAMCLIVTGGIITMTFLYTGPTGLLVLGTATAIGMLPAATNVKRTHCMGTIMLPCVLYFAGVKGWVLTGLGL